MASSSDQSTPSSPGKAVVFLKASKGNDDPYAVVRRTDKSVYVRYSCRTHSDPLNPPSSDTEKGPGSHLIDESSAEIIMSWMISRHQTCIP